MTKPVKPEGVIIKEILKDLKTRGVYAWRNNSGATVHSYYNQREGRTKNSFIRYGSVGMPDIMGVHQGSLFAIEVKTRSGKTTPAQDIWLEKLRAEGCVAFIARSVEDLDFLYLKLTK